jgi:hypothetical protein
VKEYPDYEKKFINLINYYKLHPLYLMHKVSEFIDTNKLYNLGFNSKNNLQLYNKSPHQLLILLKKPLSIIL